MNYKKLKIKNRIFLKKKFISLNPFYLCISSNLMKVVIYSSASINNLEKYAKKYFSEIINKNVERPKFKEIPFNKENSCQFFKMVPFKDKNKLEISWIIENVQKYYKTKPDHYISHLLGHEGKNSLLSLLIDEGLATSLEVCTENEMYLFSFLIISIKLTEKGKINFKKEKK